MLQNKLLWNNDLVGLDKWLKIGALSCWPRMINNMFNLGKL